MVQAHLLHIVDQCLRVIEVLLGVLSMSRGIQGGGDPAVDERGDLAQPSDAGGDGERVGHAGFCGQ